MNKVIILILGIFFMISCTDENKEGQWDDNIRLSTNSVELVSETDSVTITTEGDGWWIDAISFEDSNYGYYDSEDVNLESESYSIIEEHFLVEKRDKNTLFVKINKNTLFVKINKNNTGSERIMNITFQAGNYFDYVRIKQAGN